MTRRYRLTPSAQNRLREVFLWTIDRFGDAQAERYLDDLLRRFAGIAAGDAPSQSCAQLISDAAELRFARAGGHFIIFEAYSAEIIIHDLLHARSDLPAQLKIIAEQLKS